MKNECLKERKVDNPYEIWQTRDGACVGVDGEDADIIREIISVAFPEVLRCN